jgi:CheY-like chemotaxis protein
VAHRLLLVEDEAIIALNERSILERHGFSVDVRIDGIAAVEAATSADSPYDLILMDIDLGPGIDGIEAAARILDVRAVPIVFLTAHTEAETVARVEERTQYGYVLKNGREFTLVQSVKTALRLFAAHQEAAERDARFRRIFDSTPTIAIQGYRPDGTVIYWNDASEELYGYTAEEAIGASLLDLIIPESLHASVKAAVEETIVPVCPSPPASSSSAEKTEHRSSSTRAIPPCSFPMEIPNSSASIWISASAERRRSLFPGLRAITACL